MGSATVQGELWGAAAETWAALQEPSGTPLYEATFDALDVADGTRLLDVGCGAGSRSAGRQARRGGQRLRRIGGSAGRCPQPDAGSRPPSRRHREPALRRPHFRRRHRVQLRAVRHRSAAGAARDQAGRGTGRPGSGGVVGRSGEVRRSGAAGGVGVTAATVAAGRRWAVRPRRTRRAGGAARNSAASPPSAAFEVVHPVCLRRPRHRGPRGWVVRACAVPPSATPAPNAVADGRRQRPRGVRPARRLVRLDNVMRVVIALHLERTSRS